LEVENPRGNSDLVTTLHQPHHVVNHKNIFTRFYGVSNVRVYASPSDL